MKRSLVLLTAAAGVAAVATAGQAAPKKPIEKTYPATAPAPDPTNYLGAGGAANYSVCNQVVPQSWDDEVFKAPAAGTLKIELTGYQGDWDLLLLNGKSQEVANSGSSDLGVPEKVTYKIKKAESFSIIACNWAGGPSGTVKYVFTYANPGK